MEIFITYKFQPFYRTRAPFQQNAYQKFIKLRKIFNKASFMKKFVFTSLSGTAHFPLGINVARRCHSVIRAFD